MQLRASAQKRSLVLCRLEMSGMAEQGVVE